VASRPVGSCLSGHLNARADTRRRRMSILSERR
jgi:hypothetical protein